MTQHNRAMALASFLALLFSACASVTAPPQPAPVSCSFGTLGIEPADISRAFRANRPLPDDLTGAVVGEVLQGSPAESAGVLEGDVILQVGDREISNSCDATEALFGRSCDPVRIVLFRDGARIDVTVTPVDAETSLTAACERGSPSACFRLAWLMWSGAGVKKDTEGARALYKRACDDVSAEACAYLGYDMMKPSASPEEVVGVLTRACDMGSGAGCAHLAFMYATGMLVERDDAISTPLYVRACDLGDSRGCYNVGIMYRDGRGVDQDRARAIAAYEEGCRGGSSTACTDLGWYYQHGEGVEKDETRAFDLFRRGCKGTSCQPSNLRGCVNLGLAYKDGIGIEKDPLLAAQTFESACRNEPDPDDVYPDSNRWHACALLGSMYLSGRGLEIDTRKGRDFSVLGCDGRDAFGCFNAAVVFAAGMGIEVDMIEAARYYRLACDLGDAEGCFALGGLYARGSGVEKDPEHAERLFEKACAAGFREACGRAVVR